MNSIKEKNILAYAGRFILLYTLLYLAIGVIFVLIQNSLPAKSRAALDFFKLYNLGKKKDKKKRSDRNLTKINTVYRVILDVPLISMRTLSVKYFS
jgi:predicted membrane protein